VQRYATRLNLTKISPCFLSDPLLASFSLRAGETVAVVGASGSGKSGFDPLTNYLDENVC
ncbi:hypothetical protein O5853_32705, partial [Escherichia coli]|nr:hypothetical protein [Escherichia coli]